MFPWGFRDSLIGLSMMEQRSSGFLHAGKEPMDGLCYIRSSLIFNGIALQLALFQPY